VGREREEGEGKRAWGKRERVIDGDYELENMTPQNGTFDMEIEKVDIQDLPQNLFLLSSMNLIFPFLVVIQQML